MYQKEIAKNDDRILWTGAAVVTVLEVVSWLFFYWIHVQIRS
jgi:hypothetical protein